jgi:hypothetical protein
MTVGYHVDAGRPRISYNCTGARSGWGGPHCQHLSGGCLDAYVAGQVLQVLSPAAVEIHLQAVQQALADRAAVEKAWQQRLERAHQQADRARRCYRLAEPEHRLVCATWSRIGSRPWPPSGTCKSSGAASSSRLPSG